MADLGTRIDGARLSLHPVQCFGVGGSGGELADGTRRFKRSNEITLLHRSAAHMLTGQRRGELALARWKNVDLKAKTWTIPNEDAKAGKGHVVPLTDWAV